MCGDQLSSSWEAENRMMGQYDKGGDAWATKEFKPVIEKFQTEFEIFQSNYPNVIPYETCLCRQAGVVEIRSLYLNAQIYITHSR